jgi:hypothetical protein
MAINDYTPEQKAALDYFMPYVRQAVSKVASAPGGDYYITAFIVRDDVENPVLLHVGNIPDTGDDLVLTHFTLASMCAEMQAENQYERREIKSAPSGSTPEEVADKLAVALLAGNSEGISEEARELLAQYLQSRKK